MRVWNKESIQDLLARNDIAVAKAIVAIYGNQTDGEQKAGGTKQRNGLGFGLFDDKLFSDMAKVVLSGGTLSQSRIEYARTKGIAKYWKQLVDIANANEANRARRERDKKRIEQISAAHPIRSFIIRRTELTARRAEIAEQKAEQEMMV